MSAFTLRLDGSIVLPDDDGDPAYYLQPDDAFELTEFIAANTAAISAARDTNRRAAAYATLAQLVAAGLPAPFSARQRWDGRLVLDVDTEENFAAWIAATDGTRDADEHPTLGTRATCKTAHFSIEGPWVAAEPVTA